MSAMSWALRVSVPLNRRCSMKWEMPFCSGVSWREPRFIQTPRATERRLRIGSVISTSRLANTSLRISSMDLMVSDGRGRPLIDSRFAGASFPPGLDVLARFEMVDRGRVGLRLTRSFFVGAAGDPEFDETGRVVALLDLSTGVLEDRAVGIVRATGDHLDHLEMPA